MSNPYVPGSTETPEPSYALAGLHRLNLGGHTNNPTSPITPVLPNNPTPFNTPIPQPVTPQVIPPPKTTSPSIGSGGSALNLQGVQEAQKYCKYATSALNYDDVKNAVDYLTKALELLKTGNE